MVDGVVAPGFATGTAPPAADPAYRCGIDSVEIARIERLLRESDHAALLRFFTECELADAGEGPGRAASLAARFAAKEACVKLFPPEAARVQIEPADFSVVRDDFGAPRVLPGPRAEALVGRYRLGPIALSMTHDRTAAKAVAITQPAALDVPGIGRFLYRCVPLRRRVILDNLRRVYGATLDAAAIERLAQAHYAHLWRLAGEFLRFRWLSTARKLSLVRVENVDAFADAYHRGKGVLLLTGHFGNWEVATVAGIASFPHMRGRFHFVRRAVKPDWLDRLVTRRFQRAGFGVFKKRGSLDAMLAALAQGDAIVFPFDQHASPPDGIAVDFFGTPAWTFKSLAVIALATGAPVLPATSWRESDGTHVLRFEAPIPAVEHAQTTEAIRLTTRAYNAALERFVLRRPEQWYWVHRRWKHAVARRRKRPAATS